MKSVVPFTLQTLDKYRSSGVSAREVWNGVAGSVATGATSSVNIQALAMVVVIGFCVVLPSPAGSGRRCISLFYLSLLFTITFLSRVVLLSGRKERRVVGSLSALYLLIHIFLRRPDILFYSRLSCFPRVIVPHWCRVDN